jgi:hypothetical protein
MTTNESGSVEVFAIEFAQLAREIAMDIFPLDQILEIHKLSTDEWLKIRDHPTFQSMFQAMLIDWNLASSTRERVRVKAATGLESQLETYIREISDETIPLIQRVEAGKFLARLGELDGAHQVLGGAGSDRFQITLNIGTLTKSMDAQIIDGEVTTVLPEPVRA